MMSNASPVPLDLRALITELDAAIGRCDFKVPCVYFDWAGAYPTSFDSYRGYYERLGLSYCGDYGSAKAKVFLDMCRNAVGQTFEGWKGGEFRMHEKTSIHVACQGCTSETRITAVDVCPFNGIILRTSEIAE